MFMKLVEDADAAWLFEPHGYIFGLRCRASPTSPLLRSDIKTNSKATHD
jgi:hypothetical protein